MASHDNEGITILPPEKKRKLTSFAKCVICQADKSEVLRKGKESSVETFLSALSLRQDEVYQQLYPSISNQRDLELFWHSSCYSSYKARKILGTLQVLKFPHHFWLKTVSMLRRIGFLDQQSHPLIGLLVSFAAIKLTKKSGKCKMFVRLRLVKLKRKLPKVEAMNGWFIYFVVLTMTLLLQELNTTRTASLHMLASQISSTSPFEKKMESHCMTKHFKS